VREAFEAGATSGIVKPDARLRRTVREFYAWIGSVLLAGAAPLVAARLIHHDSPGWHVAGVALGTLGWVPLMVVTARIIQRGDEYAQRIHLLAIAWAFVATLLSIALLDWLARAGFVDPPALSILWLAIAVLWLLCILAAKSYHERPR
jgi:hypothetical protein